MYARFPRGFIVASLLLLILTPLVVIIGAPSQLNAEIWAHLRDFLLLELLGNTLVITLSVACLCLAIGVPLGWWVARYEFPGRRIFSWALMLPLAIPAYVQAMALIGLYDFSGPLQTMWRALGWPTAWLPEIRTTKGLVLSMTFSFYPYVYLLARNSFETMGQQAIEIGQSLGYSPKQSFWKVALPLARPWIAGGVLLVVMETLADFGTVSVFNIDTFTTAIYKSWFSLFSLATARQLASLLVLMVFVLLMAEWYLHRRQAYYQQRARPMRRVRPPHARWLLISCSVILLLAFVLPFAQLIYWTMNVWGSEVSTSLLALSGRSVGLSLMAAMLIALAALVFTVAVQPFRHHALLARLATLGYAMPGSVLAVGVFIPIAWMDQQLVSLWGLDSQASVLKGTLWVMLWAYLVRFFGVAHSAVGNGMKRMSPNHAAVASSLGLSVIPRLVKVYLPMLKGSVFTAMLMVFVDVMKEMPITLMTRPFGWDTLSSRIFSMTSEGMWENAAPSAVLLIVAGLIPVMLISRHTERHASE